VAAEPSPHRGRRALPLLPHAHPFRLLDQRPDGSVGLLVSADAVWLRGAPELPPLLAVEVLSQAALGALPAAAATGASPRTGLLAGLEGVRFHAALRPGDLLVARATLLGGRGSLVKVRAELRRDDVTVVEGDLLLALTGVGGQR